MAKNRKRLQDKELENVSGGAVADYDIYDYIDICPNCKSQNVTSETTGSGCDKKTTYTCKDCGHTW